MRYTLIPALAVIATLAGCSSPPRYGAPTAIPDTRIATRYHAIEIVQATLPSYAQGEEIYLRKTDGAIEEFGPLWADDPARAVTLQLARDLGAVSGGLAAPDPWPFSELPDVRVDVRIEDFLATEAGVFLLSGQYFVAPESGGRDRARRFDISVPIAQPPSPAAVVTARGSAVSRLALDIAENGLR